MKTKVEIRKYYNLKIKELIKHNKLYYDKSSPVIKDSEYDQIKNEILNLENKYSYLKNKASPNVTVGYKPSNSFKKFKHKVPM